MSGQLLTVSPQAHKRRFAKLREAAMNVDPEADVRDLVRAQRLASQPEKSTEDRLSKRAEKKVRVTLSRC